MGPHAGEGLAGGGAAGACRGRRQRPAPSPGRAGDAVGEPLAQAEDDRLHRLPHDDDRPLLGLHPAGGAALREARQQHALRAPPEHGLHGQGDRTTRQRQVRLRDRSHARRKAGRARQGSRPDEDRQQGRRSGLRPGGRCRPHDARRSASLRGEALGRDVPRRRRLRHPPAGRQPGDVPGKGRDALAGLGHRRAWPGAGVHHRAG